MSRKSGHKFRDKTHYNFTGLAVLVKTTQQTEALKVISMAESNNYAVIRTGGKQYTAAPGEHIVVERLPGDVGSEVIFKDVLLVKSAEKGVTVGRHLVEGASVKAKILAHERAKKVVIFKKRRRKGYTKKQGHRQEVTRVEIQSVA